MVAHPFNPRTQEAEAGEFKASLVYRASSRKVRAVTKRNPVLKKAKEKKKGRKEERKREITTTLLTSKPFYESETTTLISAHQPISGRQISPPSKDLMISYKSQE